MHKSEKPIQIAEKIIESAKETDITKTLNDGIQEPDGH